MNKLINIICASLISFSCNNEIVREDKFKRVEFKGKTPYSYTNPRSGNKYVLDFHKERDCENHLDVYLITQHENKLYSSKDPYFKLMDLDGDWNIDIILFYIINGDYDTLKVRKENAINLNDENSVIDFLVSKRN